MSQYCNASLHVFLHDDESLPYETNQVILKLFTSTYRTAKDFKHLPLGDTSII